MKLGLRLIQNVTYSLQRGLIVQLLVTNTTACTTPTMMCMHCSHWCIYDTQKIQSCSARRRLLNADVLNVEFMLNV
jgi:hypothetical protein